MMQPRFEKRIGSTPFSLVEQPRFRAGFDFMRLRADVGEVDVVLADWWQEFSLASDAVREDLVLQAREEQGKGQRRVRVAKPLAQADDGPRHLPSAFAQPETGGGPEHDASELREGGEGGASDAPRKRRRRRRKPGEGAAAQPPGDSGSE